MNTDYTYKLDAEHSRYVEAPLEKGLFKSVDEIVHTALDDMMEMERKKNILKNEIEKGINSGWVEDFDPIDNLEKLKAEQSSSYA